MFMEMNMHVPQSIQTENELIQLAAVPTQIISPRHAAPIIGVVQDVALGLYRLTKDDVRISQKQLFNLLCNNSKFNGEIPRPLFDHKYYGEWSGRQVLSSILPHTVNLRHAGGDKNSPVIIENGIIKQGVFDKGVYQKNGVVQAVLGEHGINETQALFDNTQRLICNWLVQSGFSVGISDLVVDNSTNKEIRSVIDDMLAKAYDIVRSIHTGTFENKSIKSNQEYFEGLMTGLLSEAVNKTGNIGISNINDNNRMMNMVRSGSKGNTVNVSQMIACLGQQAIEGKRAPYGFDDRTLPHFSRYDDGPEARGFVQNSFIKGLTPQEYFFHAMGGREGLIDTAVKTSDTGYLQRKLVKAMEDCKVNYDLTVRNASGSIVQFLYGEDGMNSTKIETHKLQYIEMSLPDLEKNYLITEHDSLAVLNDETREVFLKTDGAYEKLRQHFDQVVSDRDTVITKMFRGKMDTNVHYPINLARIIRNAEALHRVNEVRLPTDLSPLYVLETIETLISELVLNPKNGGAKIFAVLLRAYLAPKLMVFKYQFSRIAFDHIVEKIRVRFYESIAHPSEMVGVVSAQSIGEPLTQLSILKSSKVVVMTPSGAYSGEVGTFIDKLLESNKQNVVDLGHNSVVLDLAEDYKIIGVSNDEKTSWKRISQISRHPANGGMVTVYTKSGKKTCATLSHSFLKRSENGIVPIQGSDLKVGDRIPVAKHIPEVENALTEIQIGDKMFPLDFDFGWICGAYLADGSINYHEINITKSIPEYYERVIAFSKSIGCEIRQRFNHWGGCDNKFTHKAVSKFFHLFGNGSYNKTIPAFVFESNKSFIAGVISGYFDGDGNVHDSTGKEMIRSCSVSEQLTAGMIQLLAYFDIFASKCLETRKEENCGLQHTIQIPRKYARQFQQCIGLKVHHKAASLEKIANHMETKQWHTRLEFIDKIPELGNTIAYIGKRLELPGQSRNYGRWVKKESIGRTTLLNYIELFEETNAEKKLLDVAEKIEILKQAAFSDVIWDEIVKLEYQDDPQEFVYDFTVPGNDSFMVDCGVLVHNTLNSVVKETELLIMENDNTLRRVKIGEFIDDDLETNKQTEDHPNDTKLGWIKEKNIKVLSCDENGRVDWRLVEAVTRHPPINKDGSNTLVKVTMQSGREVIATKAKSFLKRVDNKIVPVSGEELLVGDYLPVSTVLPIGYTIKAWDISSHIPKTEWLYMSEVKKALAIREEYLADKKNGWFVQNKDTQFIVPYKRADCLTDAFGAGKCDAKRSKNTFIDGCVYPMSSTLQPAHIPEKIPLDEDFGFFLGAYLSEGMSNKYHIIIANLDDDFNDKVDRFCQKFNIKYHIDDRLANGGRTKSLRLHSKLLATLLGKAAGKTSLHKRFPPELFAAPHEFLKAVLDGYFSGDGTVPKKECAIKATSVSMGLLHDIQQLLTIFSIQSTVRPVPSQQAHALKKGLKAELPYELRIPASSVSKFQETFKLTLREKQDRLDMKMPKREYALTDIVPNVKTAQFGEISIKREDLESYLSKCENEEDRKVLEAIQNETICYDRVIRIEEVASEHPYVYDLTVEHTRTFNLFNGLCVNDTFHSSGQAAASETVRGVPRMKELLSVSKNIKTPSMMIYLDETINKDFNKASEVLNRIETTHMRDILKSSAIYFSPEEFETDIEDDRSFMQMYKVFEELEPECNDKPSPWLLRFEFDKAKMDDLGITMHDVHITIYNFYEETVKCAFSDDNSDKLIFRVRLADPNLEDAITDLKALEQNIIENMAIKGVKGINKVMTSKNEFMTYNPYVKTFENTYEWYLNTDGTQLKEVLGLPEVDARRTVSNHVHEIYSVLGVEAARQCLVNELFDCLDGVPVNFRHISLLADVMTCKGQLVSIDRHGINRSDIGPLAKCSFEETSDMLIKAGLFAEVDNINGVSANIMLGQIPPCGTGDTTILMDEGKLLEILPPAPVMTEMTAIQEEVCTMDNVEFDFELDADAGGSVVPEASEISLTVH
jgi:DNA-directed RNA polymerase beta' subunit